MANYIRPRGTLDIYESQATIYQTIQNACQKVANRYHFKMIQTPMFESTSLFSRSTGESSDIVTKEMYTFLDKGNRELSLRPEGTAGTIRAIIENKLYAVNDLPLKYYYQGSFFRYERPQAGRYREFSQFGIEVVGTHSYLDDVEVILIACDILKELKISDYTVKINSFGNSECRTNYRNILKNYFLPYRDQLCADCQNRLIVNPLRILDCKIDKEFFLKQNIPTAIDSLDEQSKEEFEQLKTILDDQNIPYIIDHKLVRGLDYYTGIIFEIDIKTKDQKTYTIGGGGHYSNLVKELGGPDLSCVGFGLGINRLALILEDQFGIESFTKKADIYIMPLIKESHLLAIRLSKMLRELGFCVVVEHQIKSLSSMFKYASKHQFRYAIVLGEDEIQKQIINIKDLSLQKQESISLEQVGLYFKEVLK